MNTAHLVVNERVRHKQFGGVTRYVEEILACWAGRYDIGGLSCTLHGLSGHLWEQFILPTKLGREQRLWSPANSGPLGVPNQMLTLHDCSALEAPLGLAPGFRLGYRVLLPQLVRTVRRVITVSEFSRQRIQTHFRLPAEKVVVIPNGVNPAVFYPRQTRAALKGLNLPECYFVAVGGWPERKGWRDLLAAWRESGLASRGVVLVLVGGPMRQMKTPGVLHLGRIDDDALAQVYSKALCLVHPAYYEGFGLPLVEAMACGCPVIACQAGATPEVLADAGWLVPPRDASALAAALREMAADVGLRIELRGRGLARASHFSWERTAAMTWEVLTDGL